MILRLVLWRLDDRSPPVEELRDRIGHLAALEAPSAFLVNEGAEQIGMLLVAEDDEPPPPQIEALRQLVGREPDLYEEYETLSMISGGGGCEPGRRGSPGARRGGA